MAKNQVLKFEGDIRMWSLDPTTMDRKPIIDDPADIYGNLPLEASASIFNYEAGEELTVVSKRRDRYNQVIYGEQEPGTSSISLTLVAVPAPLLARVFYGEAAEIAITGAAVADEAVTFAADALNQQLAHTYIAASPAPTVENIAGDVTYVAGVDYVLDRRLGRIRRLVGGAITATQEVRVSYTYTSFTLTRIRGGVKPQDSYYLHGDFKNRPDSSDMILQVWQANLATDGGFDLFSSEPLTLTLTGSLITPEDKTEPYVVDMIATA